MVHAVERDGEASRMSTVVDEMVVVRDEEVRSDLGGLYTLAGKLGLFVLCPYRNFRDG